MQHIRHRLRIGAPANKVYDAITTQEGLAGWWCRDTTAKPETGTVARFVFSPDYFKEMAITELQPLRLIRWTCTKGYEEWIGTRIAFELQPDGDTTVLSFHHEGWTDYTPMYMACNYHWALFMRSLKLLCETGKGRPDPEHDK